MNICNYTMYNNPQVVVTVVILPPTNHGNWTKQWAQGAFYPVIHQAS